MESGFIKRLTGIVFLLFCTINMVLAQYAVKATAPTLDQKDLTQKNSKVFDQNGERCALIKFETPLPALFQFDLGKQTVEKRENKDDEIWIWVSPDVKKMTIRCPECAPLKDYRVNLKSGNVYHAKLTTGLPQETATVQKVVFYCEQTPYFISFDGSKPVESNEKTYYAELPIGEHNVTISAKLYQTYNAAFRLYRSQAHTDTVKLENNYGELLFSITPNNYKVLVNDEEQQIVNNSLKLEPGQYKITIQKERYETFEQNVTVTLGKTAFFRQNLVQAFALYTITAAEEETEIWIDGKIRGHGNGVRAELTWGKHKIEGRREGYDIYEYPIQDFNATSATAIRIPKLNKQYGGMRLSFYPPQATVYVDGKPVNAQDGVYIDPRVPTGHHFVMARMTDYTPVRDSFTVVSGKFYENNYVLEEIALGIVNITTDKGVGIWRLTEDENPLYLGTTHYTGKIPAGEQTIQLKNLSNITCQYKMYVNNKEEHEPVTFNFMRKLMVRTNVIGREIILKSDKMPAYAIKPNKFLPIEPLKYEITINKKGYQTYRDSIDFSRPDAQKEIYRAKLRKEGDTIQVPLRLKRPFGQDFFDRAGTWFIGVLDFGYTFDLNNAISNSEKRFGHIVSIGAVPFRYKYFGASLVDFQFTVSDTIIRQSLCYTPKISGFVPIDDGFAFHFYGGLSINIFDANNPQKTHPTRVALLAGASFRFNYAGRFPMDIFTEYKWPVKGETPPTSHREELFRFGILFTPGIDH